MDGEVEKLKDIISLLRQDRRQMIAGRCIRTLYITELENMLLESGVKREELDRIYEVCRGEIYGEDKE